MIYNTLYIYLRRKVWNYFYAVIIFKGFQKKKNNINLMIRNAYKPRVWGIFTLYLQKTAIISENLRRVISITFLKFYSEFI